MKAKQGLPTNYTGEITRPIPFRLKTDAKSKKDAPSMLIEVNVGPGKTGVIGVHPGDNPRQLASNFCKIYHLDEMAEEGLFKIIVENMESADHDTGFDNSEEYESILEARENDEQTSIDPNSHKMSKARLQHKSDHQQLNGLSDVTNSERHYEPQDDYQPNHNLVQHESNHHAYNEANGSKFTGNSSEYEDGEDIQMSPENSFKRPNCSIMEETDTSGQRQYKFSQDRMSDIHMKGSKYHNPTSYDDASPGAKSGKYSPLDAVKEEDTSNEQFQNIKNDDYTLKFKQDSNRTDYEFEDVYETQIIEQEIDDSSLLRDDCKPLFILNLY